MTGYYEYINNVREDVISEGEFSLPLLDRADIRRVTLVEFGMVLKTAASPDTPPAPIKLSFSFNGRTGSSDRFSVNNGIYIFPGTSSAGTYFCRELHHPIQIYVNTSPNMEQALAMRCKATDINGAVLDASSIYFRFRAEHGARTYYPQIAMGNTPPYAAGNFPY